jgi:hypothetical protein
MVGYISTCRLGEFGCADVETPVQLERVAIDDLAAEFLRDPKGEIALSSPRGTYDGYCRGVW